MDVKFRPIETAPKDRHVLLLTLDFGVVDGWWRDDVPDFYKSNPDMAVYDPDDHMGSWVSEWSIAEPDEHGRLYCGCTPIAWTDIPSTSDVEKPHGDNRIP